MNTYLLTILGVVIVSSFLTAILPSGKTTNTVKGIVKTVCLLTIISPILGFLQNAKNPSEKSSVIFQESGIQTDGEFIKYYSELRVNNAQTLLQKELFERFSAQTNVRFLWKTIQEQQDEYNQIQITEIVIHLLSEISEKEKEDMRIYVSKNYCSEVRLE